MVTHIKILSAEHAQTKCLYVLEIEKLSHIIGPTPILEMARAYGLRHRLWLLPKFPVRKTQKDAPRPTTIKWFTYPTDLNLSKDKKYHNHCYLFRGVLTLHTPVSKRILKTMFFVTLKLDTDKEAMPHPIPKWFSITFHWFVHR